MGPCSEQAVGEQRPVKGRSQGSRQARGTSEDRFNRGEQDDRETCCGAERNFCLCARFWRGAIGRSLRPAGGGNRSFYSGSGASVRDDALRHLAALRQRTGGAASRGWVASGRPRWCRALDQGGPGDGSSPATDTSPNGCPHPWVCRWSAASGSFRLFVRRNAAVLRAITPAAWSRPDRHSVDS